MKTKTLLALITLFCIGNVIGQNLSLDLTFTAVDNAAYVQLDSVKVMFRSQVGESMIYYPDTTLSVNITPGDILLYIGYSTGFPVGVRKINQENSSFHLFQSYPNPVKDYTMISMYIPRDGTVSIMINDLQGRVINSINQQMGKGIHSFRFSPGNSSFYFLSARWKGMAQSIKIVNTEPNTGKQCMLDYIGNGDNGDYMKSSLFKNNLVTKQSGILDAPSANETYTFQFTTNIPCPGIPIVDYEGQVYNTIQIFSQCWLKENLNVGTMIPGTQAMSNNSLIEKYCYFNEADSCNKYGGLYQWDEMMQYTTQQGTRGICPPAWHLPTDEEWKVLEGAVDSQYGIGDYKWDWDHDRGFDAGTNLKTTSGWHENGNGTDLFGFSGMPGGSRNSSGDFFASCHYGNWWTSTEFMTFAAWDRDLDSYGPEVGRWSLNGRDLGYSVRCIRDY